MNPDNLITDLLLTLTLLGGIAFGEILNPDIKRTTCEMVISRGFPCEIHPIRTTEPTGYLVEAHRIRMNETTLRGTVILQTGLIGTSADFVMANDDVSRDPTVIGQNMAIELAKQGYDVWMTNNRGNEYGLKHDKLSPKNTKFWKFTFDEMSSIDVPAFIDYIRNVTGSEKVGFIGHSQGSAVMFALLSSTAKYNDIVQPFIAVSPITRIGKAITTFRLLLDLLYPVLRLTDGPIFTNNELISAITALDCSNPLNIICRTVFFSVVGYDNSQLNSSRLAVYTAHQPSSTSKRNLLHFDQLFHTDRFQKFDYGRRGNLQHYHQQNAPIYNLTEITHQSVYVIYSQNDLFIPVSSVDRLRKDIPGAKEWFLIKNPKSNHMDPLIGVDIAVEVNKKVIEILNKETKTI